MTVPEQKAARGERRKRRFRDRLCLLRSIDQYEVPSLTNLQWERFRDDPLKGDYKERLTGRGESA